MEMGTFDNPLSFGVQSPQNPFGNPFSQSMASAIPATPPDSFTRSQNLEAAEQAGVPSPDKPLSRAEKLKSFAGGIISPLTDPFKSPKKFLIAAGIFLAHAVVIGATGGGRQPSPCWLLVWEQPCTRPKKAVTS